MTSYQIAYFLSAAGHLNFTRAAEELNTSQPTVSRQVALLEEELGITLFLRDKGGTVSLTSGGSIMLEEFKNIKYHLNAAIEKAARVKRGLEGGISIGYLSNLNTDIFIHPPLSVFSRLHPGVNIKIESATFSVLREKLARGLYDIIYTYSFELPALEHIRYEKVYDVTPMIVMSKSHPLAKKADLTLSDFNGETFLLPEPEECYGRVAELLRICNSLGLNHIGIKCVANIESMMFSIRYSFGVGLISTGMDCFFDNQHSHFPVPNMNGDVYIAAVWNVDNRNPIIPLYLTTFSEYKNMEEQRFPNTFHR